MNFYDYYNPTEEIEGGSVYAAAAALVSKGFKVIPLEKGSKNPANWIKSVGDLRVNPINTHNLGFYFKGRDCDLGLMLEDNMEFIDIDTKNKAGLTKAVLTAIEFGWPELYEKLIIDYTPTIGSHLFYRSEIVGGDPVLAQVHSKPHPLTIIERISVHNTYNKKYYIKISPSEGYEYIQGSPFNIQTLTAEERNWLGAVCASFNKVIIPSVSKFDVKREDSPWNIFNKKNNWEYTLKELVERNWVVSSETDEKISIKRPGTEQRQSGSIFKDTNILYLYSTSAEFESGRPYSPYDIYTFYYHDGNKRSANRQLASEGVGVDITLEGKFWRKEGKKIAVKYTELLNWIHSIGYRKYNGSLVQIVDNIVEIVEEDVLKRIFLNEMEQDMVDNFYERVSTIFSESNGLLAMIDEMEDKFIEDTKKSTWIFFRNVAVKVTDTERMIYKYSDIYGYIWKSEIIDRDYFTIDYSDCDADKFVNILGGEKAHELKQVLGYTINRYKDKVNPRAVLLMEDIDPDDEGEGMGGSGKGLLFDFIRPYRKVVDFDGKSFNFADNHLWQNIDWDTSIIFIDDVEKKFPFDKLFSILTGALPVNKKNQRKIIIPFEKSPKIFLTSNYSVGKNDSSSVRRKHEFAVVKHFDSNLSPSDEFGHEFFSDWDAHEWAKFDNFMVSCCFDYLSSVDKKNIGNITVNSLERSLINDTSKEFIEYMDGQLEDNFFDFAPHFFKSAQIKMPDGSMVTNAIDMRMVKARIDEIDNYFLMLKPAFVEKIKGKVNFKSLTTHMVSKWLKIWANHRDVIVDAGYYKRGHSDRFIRIISWPKLINYVATYENGNDATSGNGEKVATSGNWKPVDNIELF